MLSAMSLGSIYTASERKTLLCVTTYVMHELELANMRRHDMFLESQMRLRMLKLLGWPLICNGIFSIKLIRKRKKKLPTFFSWNIPNNQSSIIHWRRELVRVTTRHLLSNSCSLTIKIQKKIYKFFRIHTAELDSFAYIFIAWWKIWFFFSLSASPRQYGLNQITQGTSVKVWKLF